MSPRRRSVTQELHRKLMAFADIGIYRYTVDGIVLSMDLPSLRILELEDRYPDPSVVVGMKITDLFDYELQPGTLRKTVVQHKAVKGFEYKFRTLLGTLKCCVHDAQLVRDPDTQQDAIQVITRDVTDLKLAQDELEESNRELALANAELQTLDELKNNLLANVSHELRSPLVSVKGYADLLKSGSTGPVNEDQRRQLQIIVNNVDRVTAIVDELLDAARLDRPGPTLKVTSCDVNGLVEAALLSVTPKANQRSIRLEPALAAELPHIEADPQLLSQVLVNLLTNAIKFTEPGGDVVARTSLVDDDEVCIAVSDNGIGIASDHIDRIFDRFYQVDTSSTRKYTGLGLGLTLSRDIVSRHGGIIAVVSVPTEGTTFRVILPRALPPEPWRPPSSDGHVTI